MKEIIKQVTINLITFIIISLTLRIQEGKMESLLTSIWYKYHTEIVALFITIIIWSVYIQFTFKIRLHRLKNEFNSKIMEFQISLGEFNNLFITLHQQCKEQFPNKKEIWDWDWNKLTEKIHNGCRSIMDLRIT